MADASASSARRVLRATQTTDPSAAPAGYVASRGQASRTRRARAGVGAVPRRAPSPWPVVAGLAVLAGLLVLALVAAHNLNHSSSGHRAHIADGADSSDSAAIDGEQYLYASPAEVGIPVVVYRVLDDDAAHTHAHRETLHRLGRAMALLCSPDASSVAAFDGPGRRHVCQRNLSRLDLDFTADAADAPENASAPANDSAVEPRRSRLLQLDAFLAGFVSRRFHNAAALARSPFNGTLPNRRPAVIVAASPDDGPSVSALDIASALAAVAAEAAEAATADDRPPHQRRRRGGITVADCTTRGPAHLGRADPFAGDQVALSWSVGGNDGGDGSADVVLVASMGCAVVLPPGAPLTLDTMGIDLLLEIIYGTSGKPNMSGHHRKLILKLLTVGKVNRKAGITT